MARKKELTFLLGQTLGVSGARGLSAGSFSPRVSALGASSTPRLPPFPFSCACEVRPPLY